MNAQKRLKEKLRYLLLPISPSDEERAIELLSKFLTKKGIFTEDQPEYLSLGYVKWREEGNLTSGFKKGIQIALGISSASFGNLLAENYFSLHEELTQQNPEIDFVSSSILLSHANFVGKLAESEKMSAAKIAHVVASIDTRLRFLSWKDISLILSRLKLRPEILLKDVIDIFHNDSLFEEEMFADSGLEEACSQISEMSQKLKYPYDLGDLLRKISISEEPFIPYLQILHFLCTIPEFYDHELSVPYEFSPRGTVATWLFAQWGILADKGNPMLNNAKAVDVLSFDWANAKKPARFPSAFAVAKILNGFNEMGYSATHELAKWARRYFVRFIKSNQFSPRHISKSLSQEKITSIIKSIAANPTNSFGILEQRLVDFFAVALNKQNRGRARGLGDAVNASNTSKRKLGDCDFQNSEERTIYAYEAHGGTLSAVYLESHLQPLSKLINLRSEELEAIADIKEWKLHIIFVAYDLTASLPKECTISGIQTTFHFEKILSFAEKILNEIDSHRPEFLEHFILPLNQKNVPQKVRDQILAIIE